MGQSKVYQENLPPLPLSRLATPSWVPGIYSAFNLNKVHDHGPGKERGSFETRSLFIRKVSGHSQCLWQVVR